MDWVERKVIGMKENEYPRFCDDLASESWQSYRWRYILRGFVESNGTGKGADVYSGSVHIEREDVLETWPHEPTLTKVHTGTHEDVIAGAKKEIENWCLMRPEIMKVIKAELPEDRPEGTLRWNNGSRQEK